MNRPLIFWFRQDLRINDHPGFSAAAAAGQPLVALYILDDHSPGQWRPGGASRWWLHHSLGALEQELRQRYKLPLTLRRGPAMEVLDAVVAETDASAIYCSRQYEPWAAPLEQKIHTHFNEREINFKRYPGTLLWEPGTVNNQSSEAFKVFSPFWRRCLKGPHPELPIPAPRTIQVVKPEPATDSLQDWGLLPQSPDWAAHWDTLWQPGSEGAGDRLQDFLGGAVQDYSEGRDLPARDLTSKLSPHLHFGEISPRAVWHAARARAENSASTQKHIDKFLSELGWREFSYHLLYAFPTIPEAPFKEAFKHFPWQQEARQLSAWQRGQTGYPMVDAGMRELWQTGYMHNRVRMLVASFLTKHLRIHWREGEAWFRDTLVDADLASNACSWQWVAGSGADAAPYFRIFNPVTQGQKFDADGAYVRRWIPELSALPDKYLHQPFAASAEVLKQAGIELGVDYPIPIVDHKTAREAALAAYQQTRENRP